MKKYPNPSGVFWGFLTLRASIGGLLTLRGGSLGRKPDLILGPTNLTLRASIGRTNLTLRVSTSTSASVGRSRGRRIFLVFFLESTFNYLQNETTPSKIGAYLDFTTSTSASVGRGRGRGIF